LLALRRAIAVRWPDVIKSNGGGCNAILARGIMDHRRCRVAWWPERRWVHAVRLSSGAWVGNVHTGSYAVQGQRAARAMLRWADGAPMVLGGDFNVSPLTLDGFTLAGGHGVDQVFVGKGLSPEGAAQVLERGSLSDHAPVLVSALEKRS
jgi:endonuclease/exonuclease/phosphatase family metal-dependent hydrolase